MSSVLKNWYGRKFGLDIDEILIKVYRLKKKGGTLK
jgi:hypothetical protein